MYLFAQAPPLDAITANQFFILSIALALSTYISTIAREVEKSLRQIKRTGIREGRFSVWSRRISLWGLFVGDLGLLVGIILPISVNIYFWLTHNLPALHGTAPDRCLSVYTNTSKQVSFYPVSCYFDSGWWGKAIATLIPGLSLYMIGLHAYQWVIQLGLTLNTFSQNTLLSTSNQYIRQLPTHGTGVDPTTGQPTQTPLTATQLKVYIALTTLPRNPQNRIETTQNDLIQALRDKTGMPEGDIRTALAELQTAQKFQQSDTALWEFL